MPSKALYQYFLISLFFVFLAIQAVAQQKNQEKTSVAEVVKQEKKTETITRQQVDDLKQAVLNSKTQTILLKHILRNESVSKSYPEVQIAFKNEMGSRYRLHSVRYQIDGNEVYTYFRDEQAIVTNKRTVDINDYVGALAPGNHTLSVSVVFQGNDSGVFSYISDYKTKTEGRLSFELQRGKKTKIEVTAYEKGWILTQFKDRPALEVAINGKVRDDFLRY